MPHQCVRCDTIYDDGAQEILKGCSNCGGRLFFYIKKEKLEQQKEITTQLTKKEKKQIEKDVYDLIGSEMDKDKPVVLDLESIKILKPGKYELDLVHLFKKEPVIFKLGEGKYMIDLPASFRKKDDKKK
jgi:uncharacterized protein